MKLPAPAPTESIATSGSELLLGHDWPGNVRELRGVMESATLMACGSHIEGRDLVFELGCSPPAADALSDALRSAEDRLIAAAIAREGGNLTRAAKRLGISRSTLYQRRAKSTQG